MSGLEIALWVIGGVVLLVGGLLTIAVSIAVPAFGWLVGRLFQRLDNAEKRIGIVEIGIADLNRWQKQQNGSLQRIEEKLDRALEERKEKR